jgi:hypothetical protein
MDWHDSANQGEVLSRHNELDQEIGSFETILATAFKPDTNVLEQTEESQSDRNGHGAAQRNDRLSLLQPSILSITQKADTWSNESNRGTPTIHPKHKRRRSFFSVLPSPRAWWKEWALVLFASGS